MKLNQVMVLLLLLYSCTQAFATNIEPNKSQPVKVCQKPIDKEAIRHYNAAVELHRSSQLVEAIIEYQDAIRIEPRLHQAYSNMAGILVAQGSYSQAIKLVEKGLAIQPKNVPLLHNYAKALYGLGQTTEAIKLWRRVIVLDSSFTAASIDLALALERSGRHAEAQAVITRFRPAFVVGQKVETKTTQKPGTRVWTENNGGTWVEKFRPQEFYASYENLVRGYVRGAPLLGPGSRLDELLTDRSHRPYDARDHIQKIHEELLSSSDWSTDTKERLIDGLVEIREGVKSDPKVSTKFVNDVKSGLQVFPKSCINLLAKNGCRVIVAPLVTTVEPELIVAHPSGYDEDSTYANVGAMFSDSVVIAEYMIWGGRLVSNSRRAKAVQHEVGHALDQFLGYPSCSIEFIECYEADRKTMSGTTREFRQYFLQENGRRGPEEAFAELLACKYGAPFDNTVYSLPQEFPKCFAFIDKTFPPADTAETAQTK